jgi:hypothetical protein
MSEGATVASTVTYLLPVVAAEHTSKGEEEEQHLTGPKNQPPMQASYGHTSSSNYETGSTGSPGYQPRPAAGENYPPERGPL